MAKHNELGKLGESIAEKFLSQKGHITLDCNYSRKFGEIDIVTHEKGRVHFVEVKSKSCDLDEINYKITDNISCENKTGGKKNVSRETQDKFRPEEMLHSHKIQRLRRVIETYILQNKIDEWQFDVIIVYIDKKERKALCKYLENIVL